ncbi:MAG: Autophagy protein 22 [Pleopsidium flavum]|nr:MAG: Autophagy protein 22 [Pleopsidium flavum]
MVPRNEPPSRPLPPSRAPSNAKASFQSPTPSFEADDEGSDSDRPSMVPDLERAGRRGTPEYPGEDTRLTSSKELSGWYSYGWAAEVFVVCGVGSFIPITLEQLARERGVLLSDKSTPCRASFENPSTPSPSYASPAAVFSRTVTPHQNTDQCIISFLGAEINTASFAMYTFSLSVLIQAILIISMSGAADHGNYRKTLLLSFAFTGAVATMLFLLVVPKVYLLGAVLAIISNTCFGASFVLLNSFLPVLVRHHPSTQHKSSQSSQSIFEPTEEPSSTEHETPAEDLRDSTAALLPNPQSSHTNLKAASASPELQLSTKISSYGIGIGYIAAVLVQTLAIFLIIVTGSTTFSLRLVLFVIGLWWFTFSIPAALWLRPRPGPPIPTSNPNNPTRTWTNYILYAWRSLGRTILRARHLKDVVLFLSAWFLLSDAMATISGTAVLFAKTQLQMKPAALALINVIVTLTGVLGAFTWSPLSRTLNLRPTHTILVCVALFELIPLYGLLGYIPFIKRLGVLGLQQPWEMYPLGAVYGFVLGGLSSYCRSLFGELIPPGSEAAFYALYAITDKGSSVFGPAIVGLITDRYGEIRPAFAFLAVLLVVPLPLMACVDVERGRREGVEMARSLEGRKEGGECGGEVDEEREVSSES